MREKSHLKLNRLEANQKIDFQKVLIVVMDGIGDLDPKDNLTAQLEASTGVLSDAPFKRGNAVNSAYTPNLNRMHQIPTFRTLFAHGPSVGLPSIDDMGNSEVGHNALGAGRIFDQGAKLVSEAIENGSLFLGSGWKNTVARSELLKGTNTLHLCGLLSDGNVHSHIKHLFALIQGAKKEGVKIVRLHILLDGRDVSPTSAPLYLEELEIFLTSCRGPEFDCRIASGGGRTFVTMDRYESDWRIVERGYRAHVMGEGRKFSNALEAVVAFRNEEGFNDQDLPPFVIHDTLGPVGKVVDGDSFIFFNFRGDRAIQISRALTELKFTAFDRKYFPKIHYAGMMQYDGDLKLPEVFLVTPPFIDNTMTELLSAAGVRQFACSETQKFGHVTYFWNGNRSEKFDPELEHYVEIPSDLVPFEQRPWMKAAEIADETIKNMEANAFKVGRINFANGDMVGHTGNLAACITAVNVVDLALGRLLKAAVSTNTIIVLTADHGNADEMFEKDKKSSQVLYDAKHNPRIKTSHTLAPVPFAIFNGEILGVDFQLREDLPGAGLANIAATVLELAGYSAPSIYEPSLIKWGNLKPDHVPSDHESSGEKKSTTYRASDDNFKLAQSAVTFAETIAHLRAPDGCPWDKVQTIESLRRYLIEESYEAVEAAEPLSRLKGAEAKAQSQLFKEELGDVLLQIYLNAQIASEAGFFRLSEVYDAINQKMIHRHPHVFSSSDSQISGADEVVSQWEDIKRAEKKSANKEGISLLTKALTKRGQPTLAYGAAVSAAAKKHGFAWPSLKEVFGDLVSEVEELREEIEVDKPQWDKVTDELGDVIYAVCNIASHLRNQEKVEFDLDLAARAGIEKFVTRFQEMELICTEKGTPLTEEFAKHLSLDEWNALWKIAKQRKYR